MDKAAFFLHRTKTGTILYFDGPAPEKTPEESLRIQLEQFTRDLSLERRENAGTFKYFRSESAFLAEKIYKEPMTHLFKGSLMK